jgi:2-polyprenyl-6-hydroxyphenyl methylase/3-demethylubiquinone-9 3-methyltransferase
MTDSAKKNNTSSQNFSEKEIQHFAQYAHAWWDEQGVHAPLHRVNPVRLTFIRDHLIAHYGLDADKIDNLLTSYRVLDIGCGGGLISAPLCRMGARVTGIDMDENAIHAAKSYALDQGLEIDYRYTSTTDLLTNSDRFDIITALEVIEHVPNPELFLEECFKLLNENGILILSTLNKTLKSFLLGIVAAEYIMRWVPRGTHHYQNFIKPALVAQICRRYNFNILDIKGIIFNPLSASFNLSHKDIEVNYIMAISKKRT